MQALRRLWQKLNTPIFVYAVCSLITFFVLFLIYDPITQGMDTEDISVLTAPTVLGLFIFQYFISSSLFTRAFIPHGLVGIAWGLTFPVLFYMSYTKPFYFYEFSNDFLFGLLLFMGLVLFQYLASVPQRFLRCIAFIFSVLDYALLLIPFGQISYYVHVKHCITPASLLALYMSNPRESYEYIINGAGYTGIALYAVISIVLIYFFYRCHLYLERTLVNTTTRPARLSMLGAVLICLILYVPFYLFPRTNIIANWLAIDSYMQEMQQYNSYHDLNYNDLKLTGAGRAGTAAARTPGTVILVIGESASRNYMKVFNPNATYPDTPWESQERETNRDFIFFDHAYSSYVQTVPTLERALTERNQYDDRSFFDSTSILDVAKKAGYKTYWFSNQGIYGDYDTAISLIAKTANHAEWANNSYEISETYDDALLPLLKKVNPLENNFIVIHIMGSHIYYNDRYPSNFSVFKTVDPPRGLEAYSNSILYTDWVLQQIFEYGKSNLNLQTMVYFSDHGESLQTSHNPDVFEFEMTRIPLWIYLSPSYQDAFPETDEILRSRTKHYFTNDLLYDLMSGLFQAPSNHYDAGRDFSSIHYRFTKDTLTTLLGAYKLSDDPEHQQ